MNYVSVHDNQTFRWFTQDPAMQFSNPYLAIGNNPVMYVEPDGEFVGTVITAVYDFWRIGLTEGGFEFWNWGSKNFRDAWREFDPTAEWSRTNKAFKVDLGLFKTDPEKDFFGRAWELISRFTWQLPQTLAGFHTAQLTNLTQNANWVKHKYGATVVQRTKSGGSAVTLGNYIIGDNEIEADPHNYLFQHEYGHYLQSQAMGWAYITRVGIPSLRSAMGNNSNHDFFITEQDANRRAFLYFNKNLGDDFYVTEAESQFGLGWNFLMNPLDIDGQFVRGDYRDYKDSQLIKRMNDKLFLHSKWYDYVGWFTFPGVGVWGNLNYNSMK